MIRIEPAGTDVEDVNARARPALGMWTIYDRPADYPDHHVARLWVALPTITATNVAIVADTLEELREALPAGLLRLARQPADDPKIVEVWF